MIPAQGGDAVAGRDAEVEQRLREPAGAVGELGVACSGAIDLSAGARRSRGRAEQLFARGGRSPTASAGSPSSGRAWRRIVCEAPGGCTTRDPGARFPCTRAGMPYPRAHGMHAASAVISRFSATFVFLGRGRDPAPSRSRFPEVAAWMRRYSARRSGGASCSACRGGRSTTGFGGRLRTIRTRCGSQRVLLESIEALLRDDARARVHAKARTAQSPSAGASDTGPFARSRAP